MKNTINFKSLIIIGLVVTTATFFTLLTFNVDPVVVNASNDHNESNNSDSNHEDNNEHIDRNRNNDEDSEHGDEDDVTPTPAASPSPTPEVTPTSSPAPVTNLHFIKVVCPSYGDIAGNADGDNRDATGGNFIKFINYVLSIPHFANPYSSKPISTSEIPESCKRASGWSFKLASDEELVNDVQTIGPTDTNGEVTLSTNDLNSSLNTLLVDGGRMWVGEIEQEGNTKFGALRCHGDAVNGDNLEYIRLNPAQSDVYCITYNINETEPTPTPTTTPAQTPELTPTPTSTPEIITTPTPTPAPESTPVVTSGNGGGGNGGGGGGNSGGSINPGVGSPQPAEGFVDYSHGSVAGTSTINTTSTTGTTGEVLGASTSTCLEYLKDYIKLGKNNDPKQVVKLQVFLNDYMNAGLPVTGFYGKLTAAAVNVFQIKYWQDVLLPWVPYGLPTSKTPTSYVYKTTKHKINMLMCPELNLPMPELP